MARLQKTLRKKKYFISVPDVFFSSWLLQKFINRFMRQGKKTIVEDAVQSAFIGLKRENSSTPIKFLYKGITYIKPVLSIAKRRKGKYWIEIPILLTLQKQLLFAVKSIVLAIRGRRLGSLSARIMDEFRTKPYQKKVKRLYKKKKRKKIYKKNMVNILNKHLIQKVKKSSLASERTNLIRQLVDARVNSRRRWF